MFTSTSAPMIASVASGSIAGACSYSRQERIFGRGYKRGDTTQTVGLDRERRALKRAERVFLVAEIRDILFPEIDEDDHDNDFDPGDESFAQLGCFHTGGDFGGYYA